MEAGLRCWKERGGWEKGGVWGARGIHRFHSQPHGDPPFPSAHTFSSLAAPQTRFLPLHNKWEEGLISPKGNPEEGSRSGPGWPNWVTWGMSSVALVWRTFSVNKHSYDAC